MALGGDLLKVRRTFGGGRLVSRGLDRPSGGAVVCGRSNRGTSADTFLPFLLLNVE